MANGQRSHGYTLEWQAKLETAAEEGPRHGRTAWEEFVHHWIGEKPTTPTHLRCVVKEVLVGSFENPDPVDIKRESQIDAVLEKLNLPGIA